MYLVVYVDDTIVGAETEAEIKVVHTHLKKFVKLTDFGDMSYFLGLEVQREDGIYSLSLKGYIEKLEILTSYAFYQKQKKLSTL